MKKNSFVMFLALTLIITSCSKSERMLENGEFLKAMKTAKEENNEDVYWRSFIFSATIDDKTFDKLRNTKIENIPSRYRDFARGIMAFIQGEYRDSATNLAKVVGKLKDKLSKYEMAVLESLIGVSFLHTGDYTNAETHLLKSLKIHRTPEAEYYTAYLFYVKGDYKTALKHLKNSQNYPRFVKAIALILKGKIEYRKGNFKKAESVFKKSIETYPSLPEAMFWLGKTYEKEGFVSLARKWWRLTLRTNPNHGGAWFKLKYQ